MLVDVDHSMAAMTEETFGPTLPIMKVRRRRRGGPPRQRLAVRPRRLGVDEGRLRAARTSPAGSRPARCASTTRRSTTSRSSCRWAAGRRRGWAQRHGAPGIRKYTRSAVAAGHAARAQEGPAHVPVQGADHEHAGEGRSSCCTGAVSGTSGHCSPSRSASARRCAGGSPTSSAASRAGGAPRSPSCSSRRRVALALLIPFALAVGDELPSRVAVGWAALAGSAGIVALGAFYRALAIGTMSVVAPISATARGGAGAGRAGRGRAAERAADRRAWRSRWRA